MTRTRTHKTESYTLVDPSTVIDEYDEEDFVIKDSRRVGVEVFNASDRSGNLGYFFTMDDAVEAIEEWMRKNRFYPNIWYQNERGQMDIVIREGAPMKKQIKIKKEFRLPGTDIVLEEGDEITVVSGAGDTMNGDGSGGSGPKGAGVDMAEEPETNPNAETDDAPVKATMADDPGETMDGEGTGDMGPEGKGIERAENVITIPEDWQIPGTNIVLEKGDRIQVI